MNFHSDTYKENVKLNTIYETFNKLKKDKKTLFIIAVGFLGILLIVFSGDSANESQYLNSDNKEYTYYDVEGVKNELTELIESINGAGTARVMITYKSLEETVFATDTEEITQDDETKNKKEYVIVKKESDEWGIPLKIICPEVKGVAVICEGGDNQIVKEKIYSLVCALFSISSNSVSVASMA